MQGFFQVKKHLYFENMDWSNLLRQKAQFVPQLDDDEDTSYFDSMFVATCISVSVYHL